MPGMYQNGFPVGYNTSNLFNPQQTQFTNPQPQPQVQSNNQNGIIWVQGEAGAKSYMVAPNTTVALWDSENQIIYLKKSDQNGVPTMTILEYTERKPINPEDKFITKDEFINYMNTNITSAINEIKEALSYGKPNIPTNEPTKSAESDLQSI